MKRTIKKVKATRKNNSRKRRLLRPRGYIADIVIILLVLIFSVFLIGNVFPKFASTPTRLEFYDIDPSSVPTWTYNNLQLKTLGFKKCSGTVAIDFLIDMSGSMSFGTKLTNLQSALRFFGGNYPETGVVAMQTYGTDRVDSAASRITKVVVPFGYWQDVKPQFTAAVNSFSPSGATYSRNAMIFAKNQLDTNRGNYPRYRFAMVFISDGIPETSAGNNACDPQNGGVNGPNCAVAPNQPCRCFDSSQDPTDIAQQIKDTGVRIFTIRYVDDVELKFNSKLTTLMTNVASSPEDAFQAPLNNQLTDIMQKIGTRVCQELSAPGR